MPHMHSPSHIRILSLSLATAVALLPLAAMAQPDESGIEFVTIGAPGNAAWFGAGINDGRGSVGYEYRIGKYEVTSGQWVQFLNAAFDRPASDRLPHVYPPSRWGGVATTPQNPGGLRWTVPAGREMLPTGGIDWRTAAMYCNWLHNDMRTDREAFMDGAYDVSTFGYLGEGGGILDQLTRSEGARYWIPSIDEWMKAAHYDPNRYGEGQGGWWRYSNSSDSPYIYAPPPSLGYNGTANAGWDSFRFPESPFEVLLGAYADVQSPWGLFDTAGATGEWTEATFWLPGDPVPRYRYYEGSKWNLSVGGSADEVADPGGGAFPTYTLSEVGLRVAAAVPAPGVLVVAVTSVLCTTRRRVAWARDASIDHEEI